MKRFLALSVVLIFCCLGHGSSAPALGALESSGDPAAKTEGTEGASAAPAAAPSGDASADTGAASPASEPAAADSAPAPTSASADTGAASPAVEPAADDSAPASADAGAAAKGAESLGSLVSGDEKEKTEGDEEEGEEEGEGGAAAADGSAPAATTASGAPSLAAEQQADVQTPAEKQAQQQIKDAQDKTKAAQAQKDKADAEKLAADAQLREAESRSPIDPKEYAAAKAAEEKAKKDQADAEKAQKDAAKAKKDAEKADEEAVKNGAKLRAANNDAKKADDDFAKLKGPPPTGTKEEIAAAQKKSEEAHARADKFKEAGQTATSRADLAKADLADKEALHDAAQTKVMDDEQKLAEAQATGDPTKIAKAQKALADDRQKEQDTGADLEKARSASQKANANLNAELMKTETPDQTRQRLANEANANLRTAQSAQEDAQTNADNAQTDLENAQSSGAPPEKVNWLHRKWNVLKLKLSGATAEVESATKSANAANADAGSPVGMAQNNVQQLQAQQQDLQSQQQDAVSAAEAAGQVIQSLPAGTLPTKEQTEAKTEADARVAELQKKMNSNTAAIGEAQAHLAVTQENEAGYQKALAEKRAAKKDQEKAAAEEVAAQKNLDKLEKEKDKGEVSREQIIAAQARLQQASERNSKATALLAKTETTFIAAEKRAMGPIQKLRIGLDQSEKTIAELRIKKVRIDQELEEQKALLTQKVGRGDTDIKEIETRITRLQFESDTAGTAIKGLQQTIDEDQTKLAAIDQTVSSSVLGGEEGAPSAGGLSRQIKALDKAHAQLSTGSVVMTPEGQLRQEEMDALSSRGLGRPVPSAVDPLAPDIGTEEGLRTQVPTFQRGGSHPFFGPGGGPVANFTSPGSNPNFNNVAGKVATFAGAGAVPAFASSAGDVSFGDSAAPLPWGASSARVPSFGTTQPASFGGGSGGAMPVFGAGPQNAFGAVGGGSGTSSVAGGSAAALSPRLPGDGLTKIKTATHLTELAPPTVSAEKKQALLQAKEVLTSATENLKAAERTENLRTISSAQINRGVATLKYEQALNNASPLGVPETEASGWWNKDPSSPYSRYNVDGGGRMDAPLQTSERTEHFILSDLQTIQPVRAEQLPDGARVLAVEKVGFAMKAGEAIPALVKLAKAAAAAAA